jgi:hypothetical protein
VLDERAIRQRASDVDAETGNAPIHATSERSQGGIGLSSACGSRAAEEWVAYRRTMPPPSALLNNLLLNDPEPFACRTGDCLSAAVDLELCQDALDVRRHRLRADDEYLCALVLGPAFDQ